MKRSIYHFFIILLALSVNCSTSHVANGTANVASEIVNAQNQKLTDASVENSNYAPVLDEQNPNTIGEPAPVFGCWSALNGNVLKLSPTSIQTRNTHKVLRIKPIDNDETTQRKVWLFEILQDDPSRELQKFVAFKVLSDSETNKLLPKGQMKGWDYSSYEDFLADHWVGMHPIWIREDCKRIRPFLNVD